jgi:hypothetical protein
MRLMLSKHSSNATLSRDSARLGHCTAPWSGCRLQALYYCVHLILFVCCLLLFSGCRASVTSSPCQASSTWTLLM